MSVFEGYDDLGCGHIRVAAVQRCPECGYAVKQGHCYLFPDALTHFDCRSSHAQSVEDAANIHRSGTLVFVEYSRPFIGTVFYGAAVQGAPNRGERAHINRALIDRIEDHGYHVPLKQTTGRTREETAAICERDLGPLPPFGTRERKAETRRRNLMVMHDPGLLAAVFEVSLPSTGTGMEIVEAYKRPKDGLVEIPILALYETGFWPNDLTVMVSGIADDELPNFKLREYTELAEAKEHISRFLATLPVKL